MTNTRTMATAFTSLPTFLGLCVAAHEENGYISKATAEANGVVSTAQDARDRFFAGERPTPPEHSAAVEIIKWAVSLPSAKLEKNDFLARMRMAVLNAQANGVTTSNFGMVAAAVTGYAKATTPKNADQNSLRVVPSRAVSIDASRIVALFAAATAAGLRRPKIRLNAGSQTIKFTPAPATSVNAGCVYVKDNGGYENATYFGKITPDGTFCPSKDCSDAIRDLIVALAQDPVTVARTYGHTTGNCCFCGLELTDGRSIAVGYGPICASNYSLPWGDVTVNTELEIEVPGAPQ